LLAKAIGLSISSWLNHRFREQARSHHSRWRAHFYPSNTNPVGAGFLAKAIGLSISSWLNHRFREQARSHQGTRYCPDFLLFLGAPRPFAITFVVVRQWQRRQP
jgi:hypothetical protein